MAGKKGKSQPSTSSERQAHGGGKGDPEGERMALAGIVRLYQLGGGAN
jgi:hypothetical protein